MQSHGNCNTEKTSGRINPCTSFLWVFVFVSPVWAEGVRSDPLIKMMREVISKLQQISLISFSRAFKLINQCVYAINSHRGVRGWRESVGTMTEAIHCERGERGEGGREGGREGAYVTLRPAHCYALASMIQPSLQPFLFPSDSRPQTSSAPFDSVKLSRRTYHEQPTHDRVCMYVYMYV